MKNIVGISVLVLALCLTFSQVIGQQSWVKVEGGVWEPSDQTVADIQKDLKAYVTSQAARQSRQLHDWSEYKFQYRGDQEDGSRYVFVNALCGPLPKNPDKEMVFVLDGGSCFFNVKFNPKKSEFYDLKINGEA